MLLRYRVFAVVLFVTVFTFRLLAGDNPREVRAVRTLISPNIDGVLTDNVWIKAVLAVDFTQRDPNEGQPASERTEIRVLYDDEALYFGCMFFDSEPDKIVARLTRRDNEIECDWGSIRIDSYHDHQTAFEFTFNPAGVKVDILMYEDGDRGDASWDPVWDLQTRILPDGWSAELRIPFSILRYRTSASSSADSAWGINFIRTISRKQEWDRWAFTPKSQSGFVSRFGHLVGLQNLPEPRRLELLPFVTSKGNYHPATAVRDRVHEYIGNAGLDLKYGISSNFTLDATVNPDFGQVEADPAVLNLTTFETFYPEKRPFFIEGTQIIRFTTFGGIFGPGMFYSRRIGRAISIDDDAVPDGGRIEQAPQQTTILGAAKLSGKTSDGLSVGMLQAFTQEENATVVDSLGRRSDLLLEPFAHYNVVRLKQDVLENSNVGMILTSVAKQSRLPAFTNGYDWNLRFNRNTYQLTGFLALSHTTNSNDERITGSAGKIEFSRIGAKHWLWSVSGDFTSKNYNINDVGFFRRPNDFGAVSTLTYKEDTPAKTVRNYRLTAFLHQRQNFDGINLIRQAQLGADVLFSNYWQMDGKVGADFGLYDDRETRGKGLYRKPASFGGNLSVETDEREWLVFDLSQEVVWDTKRKRSFELNAAMVIKPLAWMDWEIEAGYERVRNQEAWVTNEIGPPVFADRSTDQYGFTLRSTLTFTRDLTLQLYGQLFLAKGHHENYRLLVGTSDFVRLNGSFDHDFNEQSLHTNVVLRWEYLPGSTLYLVWSQARSGENGDYFRTFGTDFGETFRVPPSNVLLLKASYWMSL